jgi:hypothetical protein
LYVKRIWIPLSIANPFSVRSRILHQKTESQLKKIPFISLSEIKLGMATLSVIQIK